MPLAETRTRSARRQAGDCIQLGTILRASQIPSNFVRLRPDDFALCSDSETRAIQGSSKFFLKCCPAACTSCRLGFLAPETKRKSQMSPVRFERNNVVVELGPFLIKNVRVKCSPFRIKNVLVKSSPFQMKNVLIKSNPLGGAGISNGKCADKVLPISNEKCAGKVQLRRMKNVIDGTRTR
jgi:hypothetical protein